MNLLEKSNAIKNHEITALENVENYAQIIGDKNDEINAFLEVNTENAITKAKEIDERIKNGENVGKLAGMVIGVKSNINVQDFIISATLQDKQRREEPRG